MQQIAPPGESSFKFEGILGTPVSTISNLNQNAQGFLPYNPTIVEIGAYEGAGTIGLAQAYPYAKIFASEPNPRAFAVLDERLRTFRHVSPVNLAFSTSNGAATLYLGSVDDDRHASLLPPRQPSDDPREHATIRVSSMTLDDWCKQQDLRRVHFIRLDAGGFECQILQRSPNVLQTALVVVTKTYFHKPSTSVISYGILKLFLEMTGFELLSHWYEEGRQGEATFVRKILYDSLFR